MDRKVGLHPNKLTMSENRKEHRKVTVRLSPQQWEAASKRAKKEKATSITSKATDLLVEYSSGVELVAKIDLAIAVHQLKKADADIAKLRDDLLAANQRADGAVKNQNEMAGRIALMEVELEDQQRKHRKVLLVAAVASMCAVLLMGYAFRISGL